MMRPILIATLSLLTMACVSTVEQSAAAQLSAEQAAVIEAYIQDRYPDEGAGVSALIAIDGEPRLIINRGFANLEWNIHNSEATAFRLGSISKPLTAVELLRFYEQGRLDLHGPIGNYIADLPPQMARVTSFQLMSHTSGLADHVFNENLLPIIRSGIALRDIIEMQRDVAPEFDPGTQYQYSNFNYTLLGLLVETISGMSYSNYMETQAFAARGMLHSANDDRRDIVPNRAQNYSFEDGRLLHAENVDMSHVGAAGQLLGSPEDLARWFYLLMQGDLVVDETRELAWTEVVPTNGEAGGYGLGFNVSERNDRRFIFHTGLTPGAHGAVGVYPEEGIVIVVLGNGFHLPSTGTAMGWIADEIVGAPHE